MLITKKNAINNKIHTRIKISRLKKSLLLKKFDNIYSGINSLFCNK